MTWTSFTIAVIVFYALYYGGNILFDLLRRSPAGKGDIQPEVLQFSEETTPIIVSGLEVLDNRFESDQPEEKPVRQNARSTQKMESSREEIVPDPLSGGLSISQLMPVIRQKAIVMTTRHDFERA
ncbi:MAG: hypothetical protein AB2L20_12185 [Mangrovibacterium sp.]